MSKNKVALVIGAGESTGSAIARTFAEAGYIAVGTRRSGDKLQDMVDEIEAGGGKAYGFGVDARKEDEMIAFIERVENEIGEIEVAVFNPGANVNFPIAETTARVYFKVWEMAAFGGFLMGREVAKKMQTRGRGTILFTGATASLRGGAGFSAFAGAKHALRALAQSMARELGPQGIHVAHVIVDGAIDTPFIRENFWDRVKDRPGHGMLQPASIAQNYLMLHNQPRDAWTFELDLRPFDETW